MLPGQQHVRRVHRPGRNGRPLHARSVHARVPLASQTVRRRPSMDREYCSHPVVCYNTHAHTHTHDGLSRRGRRIPTTVICATCDGQTRPMREAHGLPQTSQVHIINTHTRTHARTHVRARTHARTHNRLTAFGPGLYPGRPVPEETLTHSYPS